MADYEASALTVGTSGSGKSVGSVIPNALTIRESKCIPDFKGSLACMLAPALRARGERVRILNFGNLFTDILGESDGYNPLCIITDSFTRSGGLLEVGEILGEMVQQIYPEPESQSGTGDNEYFRNGSRSFIHFAALTGVLIDGEQATLGDAAQMLLDRESLLRHALWACGRLEVGAEKSDTDSSPQTAMMPLEECWWASSETHHEWDVSAFIRQYRADAKRVADLLQQPESRTVASFIEGAQQGMAKFSVASRGHKITSRSTCRFSEMKDGPPTTFFLIADANAITVQGPLISFIQWCCFQELKRHPIKHRPVYVIADEAANFKLHDLSGLLTWARGYGVRIHLFLQNFSAFRKAYSQDVLNTVLSETEIQQFLPGSREPEILQYLETKLGQSSVIVKGKRGDRSSRMFGVDSVDFREEGRALKTQDEIRRSKHALLFIRANKPMKTKLPPVAAMSPFRDQLGIDPHHGKPFKKRVVLRFKRRGHPTQSGFLKTFRTQQEKDQAA